MKRKRVQKIANDLANLDAQVEKRAKRTAQDLINELKLTDLTTIMPTSLNEIRERLKKHADRGINVGYL